MLTTNVRPLLKDLLRFALREQAHEIRALSGALPIALVAGAPRVAFEASLSTETVLALHRECLAQAGRLDLLPRHAASYEVNFPHIGTFSCQFKTRGGAVVFSLYPENSGELVVVASSKPNPQLSAEAMPNFSFNTDAPPAGARSKHSRASAKRRRAG